MISNSENTSAAESLSGNFDTQSLSSLLAALAPKQGLLHSSTGGTAAQEVAQSVEGVVSQQQQNAVNRPNLRVDVDITDSPHSTIAPAMDSVASSDHHKPSAVSPQGPTMITSSTPQPSTPHQPTNVFVAGLPSSWDEKKLKERFQEYGGIVSVRIVPCRRFGFVMFKNPQAAQAAIVGAHQTRPSASSQPIHVTLSMHDEGVDDVPNERLFIRGLPEWATQAHLRNVFSKFGNIDEASLLINNSGHCKGTGFVQFTRVEDAAAALAGCRTARIENFDFELEIKYSETAEVHQQRQERNRERYRAKNSSNNTTPTGSEIPSIKVHGKAAFTNATTALLGPHAPPPPPMQPPLYSPGCTVAPPPPPPQYSAQWTPPPILAPPPPMHHNGGLMPPPPPPPTQHQQQVVMHTHHFAPQQPLSSPHHTLAQFQQQPTLPGQAANGQSMMMMPHYAPSMHPPAHHFHQPPPPPPPQQMHAAPHMYSAPMHQNLQPHLSPMGAPSPALSQQQPPAQPQMAPTSNISPKSSAPPTVPLWFPTSGDMCFTSPICSEDVVRQVLQTKCGITPEKVLLIDPNRNSYAVRLPDRNLHAPVAQSLVNCVFSTGHALEVALFS